MNLLKQIDIIERAVNNTSHTLPKSIYDIYGLTSRTSQTFLNRVCCNKSILEIGTFCGASTFAMGYNNNSTLLTVDNWSETEDTPVNCTFTKQLTYTAKEFFINTKKDFNNIDYIEGDIFSREVYNQLIDKHFDLIYYDGPHDVESILKFMLLYFPLFNDCVLIFDDYNFESVKIGLQEAFKKINIRYKYIKEINTAGESKDTFWNGLAIFIF